MIHAALIASVMLGASDAQPVAHEFEVTYETGAIESHSAPGWTLEFDPGLACWSFSVRVAGGEWSESSEWFCPMTIPGDTQPFDCLVGSADRARVNMNFGSQCP